MAWFSGLAAKLEKPPRLQDFVREPEINRRRKRLMPGESLVVMDQWRFATVSMGDARTSLGPRKKPKPA